VGGTVLYPERNRLSRMKALRLYTVGSSWFSREEGVTGALRPGQLADFSVLSADYFSVPDEDIKLAPIGTHDRGRKGRVWGRRVRATRTTSTAGIAGMVSRRLEWRLCPSRSSADQARYGRSDRCSQGQHGRAAAGSMGPGVRLFGVLIADPVTPRTSQHHGQDVSCLLDEQASARRLRRGEPA